jgi:hypothetical protein
VHGAIGGWGENGKEGISRGAAHQGTRGWRGGGSGLTAMAARWMYSVVAPGKEATGQRSKELWSGDGETAFGNS